MARKYDTLWAPKPRPLLIHSENTARWHCHANAIRLQEPNHQCQCHMSQKLKCMSCWGFRKPPIFLRLKPLNLRWSGHDLSTLRLWLRPCGLMQTGENLVEDLNSKSVRAFQILDGCLCLSNYWNTSWQACQLWSVDSSLFSEGLFVFVWSQSCGCECWRNIRVYYKLARSLHPEMKRMTVMVWDRKRSRPHWKPPRLPCKNGAQTERLRTWTTSHEAMEHIASGSHEKVDGEITASCTSRERIFCDYHVQKSEPGELLWNCMSCTELSWIVQSCFREHAKVAGLAARHERAEALAVFSVPITVPATSVKQMASVTFRYFLMRLKQRMQKK